MNEIKFLRIIANFNKNQVKDFRLFLDSPYLNKGRNLKNLYTKIIKNYPDIKKMSEDYVNLIAKAKNPQVVRNYFSHITELSLDFLGYENLKNNETLLTIETGRALSNFKSTELNINKINRAKETELKQRTNIIDYYTLYKLSILKGTNYYEKHDTRNLFNSQIETISYLLVYFMIEINRRIETLNVLSYNHNYTSPVLNEFDKILNYDVINKIINHSEIKNTNFIKFFIEFYKLSDTKIIEKPDLKRLTHIVDLYDKVFESLHPLLNYIISNNLWNQWVYLRSNSQEKGLPLGYKIINKYLIKIYEEENFKNYPMDINQFQNYVLVALLYKKFDWAEQFIKKHIHRIPVKHQNDVKEFSTGLIQFYKGNFNNSLKIFMGMSNPVGNIKYGLRRKILQSYYELGYFENLYVMIDTFVKFLYETEEQFSYLYEGDILFSSYFKKLIKLRESHNKSKIEFVRKKLSAEENTNEKEWFLEKFNDLLNGGKHNVSHN